MVEPTACAVHAALRPARIAAGRHRGRARGRHPRPGHRRRPPSAGTARHRLHAGREPSIPINGGWPSQLGADTVVPPDQLARAVRRQSGSLVLAGRLTGGADVVFDCVGSTSH